MAIGDLSALSCPLVVGPLILWVDSSYASEYVNRAARVAEVCSHGRVVKSKYSSALRETAPDFPPLSFTEPTVQSG